MELTENERAVLKYDDAAICTLIAFHEVEAAEFGMGAHMKEYHAKRAQELRGWRERIRVMTESDAA